MDALPQRAKGGGEGGEAGTTLGVLVEASVKFLGDAVAAVGRNSKKFLDVIEKTTSEMGGRVGEGGGDGGGEVSPLLVCALQHSCRVAGSSSTALSLPQKAAVALFVGGAVNALVRTKVGFGGAQFWGSLCGNLTCLSSPSPGRGARPCWLLW